jgi:hypothetical protein
MYCRSIFIMYIVYHYLVVWPSCGNGKDKRLVYWGILLQRAVNRIA